MSERLFHKRLRTEAAERKRALRITRRVSASIGDDYLHSLVKHVADALGSDCVYVGALIDGGIERIDTLAVCVSGEWGDDFEQNLLGTASAHVVAEGNFACTINVIELFPLDLVLQRLDAQAYVAQRLSDSSGEVLGLMAAVYREGLIDLELPKSVLEAFAARAAAELERRRDLAELRRADERYRAFIASSKDALWRIEFEKPIPVERDEDEQIERIYRYGYLAECNAAFAALFGGASVEDLANARFAELVPRNDARLFEELRSAVRSGYAAAVIETMPLDSLGLRRYRLRSQFGIVENRQLQRMWGSIRDITELRRTELALHASERRCREMLERLQLPVVVTDEDGAILFANDALLQMGHWSKQELAATNWFDVLANPGSRAQWKAMFVDAVSGPMYSHSESPILCSQGVQRLASWDIVVLRDIDDKIEGLAAIGTDISSRKAVEAQIRQAQKLEGVAIMAAGVAHDFNNLLAVVLGHASKLLDDMDESHAMFQSLSAIRDSAIQCGRLTEQLLTVGRKQRLHLATFNLNSIIAEAERVIRSLLGEKIELELRLDPALRPIHADPAQIERVLANLAANARDAMPAGGKLAVATENVGLDEASVSKLMGAKPGMYVCLKVSDNGAGMSEEIQARIFDPFFTTKPPGEGTGMGLSTVYGIVGQSGGFISVHSRPGEGASFVILLPVAQALEEATVEPD